MPTQTEQNNDNQPHFYTKAQLAENVTSQRFDDYTQRARFDLKNLTWLIAVFSSVKTKKQNFAPHSVF